MKGEKIIHIMLDEKFNDMAIRQFEEAGAGIHEYWVVAYEIKLTQSPMARLCTLESLTPHLARPDVAAVIFHSLPLPHYALIPCIPDEKCVVWIGWGYDYYHLLSHYNQASLILPKTKKLNSPSAKNIAKKTVKYILSKLGLYNNYSVMSDLLRIDYFSPVLDVEYDLVRDHVPLTAGYIPWNYGTAENDLSLPGVRISSGRNILAGNSASATNNHAELFEAIRDQIDLFDRKVVTPLSYGDSHYRDKVIAHGKSMFGDAFIPLTDFMPKEQYLETIRSCGFVIMNHLRQQALGNICMAMLMGAKVYLNNGNPLASWLKVRGAITGSIEELDMVPLTEEQRIVNQKLVLTHWGNENQNRKTKQLISTALSKSARCE